MLFLYKFAKVNQSLYLRYRTSSLYDYLKNNRTLFLAGLCVKIIIAAFLILCSTTSNVVASAEGVNGVVQYPYHTPFNILKDPAKHGDWTKTPMVFVCKEAPVQEDEVKRAISFWRTLGYDLVGPFMDEGEIEACVTNNRTYSRGNIIIQLRGQQFNDEMFAMTTTFRVEKTDELIGAIIELQGFARDRERILEHELGHALGWKHYNKYGHLMNEDYTMGGWDIYGLKEFL